MGNRIIHFEVQADDIDRAKNFYEKTFGWKIEKMMDEKDGGEMNYWGLSTGPEGTPGINGGLYKRSDGENKIYTYDCTIMVENLDKAIADVKNNGGKITHEKSEIPEVGWFARGIDTEGNTFGLMQPTGWKPK
ncbi:MAG: VOC family protein [Patescibacteria group bacterium]